MTEADIRKIADAVKENRKANEIDKNKAFDWLFKALIGVLVWIGIGINDNVENLTGAVADLKKDNSYSLREIEKFRDYASRPTVTMQDVQSELKPLVTQINANTSELNERMPSIKDNTNRSIELLLRMKQVEDDLTELKAELNK